MKVYEYNDAIEQAYEKGVDPETGVIIDEQAWAELEALQMERDAKIEGIALWIKDLNAEAAAIKAEEEVLKQRRQKAENRAESLKNYLTYCLHGQKFKTAKVALGWRQTVSVRIREDIDPATLPLEYQRVKVTIDPDKTKLKEALKAGKVIEGVELEERQTLQIK